MLVQAPTPKIEFSPAFMTGLTQRIMQKDLTANPGGPSNTGLLGSGLALNGVAWHTFRFLLMQGTPPTDFSAISVSQRASDILASFSGPLGGVSGSGQFSLSQTQVNPVIVTSDYVAAIGSGLASWFWWIQEPARLMTSDSWHDELPLIMHQIIGTVGGLGSGEDLEVQSTAVGVGDLVRVLNLRIEFPSLWTYS